VDQQSTRSLDQSERSISKDRSLSEGPGPSDRLSAENESERESTLPPVTSTERRKKKPFAHPDDEQTKGLAKGASLDNVVEGKRSRKQVNFAQNHVRLDKDAAFHSAFIQGSLPIEKTNRIHRRDLPEPPKRWKQLQTHLYKLQFKNAAEKEYSTLREQGTFSQASTHEVKGQVLPMMWVFTYKFDEDGYLEKFKARLVVRGDLQISGHTDTYAATLAARVFRALMAIAAYFDLDIYQFDAINAFTNAFIDETIYVKYPEGFEVKNQCLKVLRALYGLPRSPLLWHKELSRTLVLKLGLRPTAESPCLFTNSKLIVFFYVDDIVVLSHPDNQSAYDDFRSGLLDAYQMREMGELKWFLGIRVLRDRGERKIWLCQDSYITKIAQRFGKTKLEGSGRGPKTPMSTEPLLPFNGIATEYEIHSYQQKTGSITYSTAISRPDTAYATKTLAEANKNPGPEHFAAVDRVIEYLEEHKFLAIELGGRDLIGPHFLAAGDAAFADDVSTRRSTEGFIFQLFGGSIDWSSVLQKAVSTSTTEAELRALAHTSQWTIWWGRFFTSLRLEIDQQLTVYCDNLQTVGLMVKDSPKLVTKLKHIDIHQHWLRELVADGTIKVEWIQTSDMAADGLTKPLSGQKHALFIKQLRMVDIRHLIRL
jgi:hypothetical protein